MIKKITQIISILFLLSLLTVSCDNKDKTGPETETSLGLKSYAGEWQAISDVDPGAGGKIIIKEDGTVEYAGAIFVEIKNNGNEEYVVEYVYDGSSTTITLKFTDKNNGTYVFKSDVMTDTGKLKR